MNGLQQTSRERRALIVDDDAAIRLLAREALEQLDLEVSDACDGAEALDRFEALSPDLVLLDVQMPKLDGFSVCREMRKQPRGKDITIVMITGLDDHTSIFRAYKEGATDFITKPINWPILIHRVRYLLRAREAFRALRESELRLSEAQRIAHLGNWEWEIGTHAAYWSEETYRIFGRPPGAFAPTYETYLQSVHPEDREIVSAAVDEALELGDRYQLDHRLLLPNGTERTVYSQGEVVFDVARDASLLRGIIQDITERKQAEEAIYRLSYYDELTGLPNADLFREFAQRALAGAERDGTRVALVLLDLDRFKRINESLGHIAGDELLKIIAERLTGCVRQSDLLSKGIAGDDVPSSVARRGGDEFAILIRGLRRSENAASFATRTLENLSEPVRVAAGELFITASLGIAVSPDDGQDVGTLLKHADAALHHAKEIGGNGFRFYAKEMNERATRRFNMETLLNRALKRGEFVLHYQPQMSLASGRTVGLEALLRWYPGDGQPVPPGEFIPVAEETGLITAIGDWVIDAVCAQLAAWKRDGQPLVPVAVNLSARQFVQQDLIRCVRRSLAEHALDSKYLELELTESVIMRDVEETRSKLQALRDIGVTIAVDDFGTGYSSMSYLKRFPLNTLKIDRTFVRDLGSDFNDVGIVRAIISLGKSLQLTTVAEGVETMDQQTILSELSCDRIQGYHYSRPLPADDIPPFLGQPGREDPVPRLANDRQGLAG
jgi:diguanylate cyclase (GGDEF)-like protein